MKAERVESLPGAWAAINELREQVEEDRGVLRFAYGAAAPTELLALAILDGEEAWRRLREGPAVSGLLRRYP